MAVECGEAYFVGLGAIGVHTPYTPLCRSSCALNLIWSCSSTHVAVETLFIVPDEQPKR